MSQLAPFAEQFLLSALHMHMKCVPSSILKRPGYYGTRLRNVYMPFICTMLRSLQLECALCILLWCCTCTEHVWELTCTASRSVAFLSKVQMNQASYSVIVLLVHSVRALSGADPGGGGGWIGCLVTPYKF